MAKLRADTDVGDYHLKNYVDNQASSARSHADGNLEKALESIVRINPQVVENANEAEDQRGERQDFEEVFNEWRRFSHHNGEQDQGNLDSWEYDSSDERIWSTANSEELIGFVSPDKRDEYIFDIELGSDGHDDFIGMVLAFAEDEDGNEHTITALRSPGNGWTGEFTDKYGVSSSFPQWSIVINAHGKDGSSSHQWRPDYTIYAEASYPGYVVEYDENVSDEKSPALSDATSRADWGDYAGLNNTRIRATRDGDKFTVEVTSMGDVGDDDFVEGAKVEFDLQDLVNRGVEIASAFQGGSHYGYCAQSEPDATFQTNRAPADFEDVVDIENGVVWKFNEETDEWEDFEVDEELQPLSFYWNYELKRLYFVDEEKNTHRIALYEDL